MSFESGSVSFRLFYLLEKYDSTVVDNFAQNIIPPLTSLRTDPLSGWVTGKHLFDRDLCDERCILGPYLYAQLLKAEKKIPAALLRAHIQREEEVELRARNLEFLPRAVKQELRERITAELQPTMPPTLNAIPTVVDFRNNLLISTALSAKQLDALVPAIRTTLGSVPVLVTPETAALRRKNINAHDLDLVSFAPHQGIEAPLENTLGMDFLTWLWYVWERDGGVFQCQEGREFGIMLEGPLTFFREGAGAHEALLRKGSPLNSQEAGTALQCGKKLTKAKVIIARDNELFSATIDSEFAFRGVKLPKGEQRDPVGRFCERMGFIEELWSLWLQLFDRFLDIRTDKTQWATTVVEMQKWIAQFAPTDIPDTELD